MPARPSGEAAAPPWLGAVSRQSRGGDAAPLSAVFAAGHPEPSGKPWRAGADCGRLASWPPRLSPAGGARPASARPLLPPIVPPRPPAELPAVAAASAATAPSRSPAHATESAAVWPGCAGRDLPESPGIFLVGPCGPSSTNRPAMPSLCHFAACAARVAEPGLDSQSTTPQALVSQT